MIFPGNLEYYILVSCGPMFRLEPKVDAPVQNAVFIYGRLDTSGRSQVISHQASIFARSCKVVILSVVSECISRSMFFLFIMFQASGANGSIAYALLCLVETDCVGFRFISDGSSCEKMYIIDA